MLHATMHVKPGKIVNNDQYEAIRRAKCSDRASSAQTLKTLILQPCCRKLEQFLERLAIHESRSFTEKFKRQPVGCKGPADVEFHPNR